MQEPPYDPSEVTLEQRHWGMLAHYLSLAGYFSILVGYFSVLGLILGPLVVWMLKRREHPFLEDQGKESLNFQITIFMVYVLGMLLHATPVGDIVILLALIYHLCFTLVAGLKAYRGITYRYPVVLRLLR